MVTHFKSRLSRLALSISDGVLIWIRGWIISLDLRIVTLYKELIDTLQPIRMDYSP